jgi:hypothetical protein
MTLKSGRTKILLGQGQTEIKNTSLTFVALHPYFSPMFFNEFPAKDQSQAGSFLILGAGG